MNWIAFCLQVVLIFMVLGQLAMAREKIAVKDIGSTFLYLASALIWMMGWSVITLSEALSK